jgi:exosome complex component RRP42
LQPTNLTIIPHKRAWLLHLDVIVLTNNGNVLDAIFLAATAALRDTRVPRTKAVEFKARGRGNGSGQSNVEDVDMKDVADERAGRDENSGLDTRGWKNATDFELEDYWDEGEPLKCLGSWPVCITLNFVGIKHFVDATFKEETAISSRLLLLFSIPDTASEQTRLQGMRLLGHGEASNGQIKSSLRVMSFHLYHSLVLAKRSPNVGWREIRSRSQASTGSQIAS